jgi:nicotinamidase/pyrazinamidase
MSRALFIIDVQNDFTEGGALGVAGGGDVARGITRLLAAEPYRYDHVIASRDWHEATGDNGGHFAAAGTVPDFSTTWPAHCVQGTPGAEYHPDLDVTAVDFHLRKGQGAPAYSIFEGTTEDGVPLADLLVLHDITDIDVVGLATDYCVLASALDAVHQGRRVRVLADLVAGVAPATSAAALDRLRDAGAEIVEGPAD